MIATVNNLSEWVDSFTGDLYSWAKHKVSDPQLAEDLVQDTFLAAAERIDAFKGDSTPKTWLFSILNYKIIDHYRSRAKIPVKLDNQSLSTFFDDEGSWRTGKRPMAWDDDNNENDNLLDNTGFQSVLKECLDALPDKWSSTVKLKYLMSKKGEEICQELGISLTNFWQIIHRAKLQLRDCIEQNWFND